MPVQTNNTMLRIYLTVASLLRPERISIQREILNRCAKKRPQLDYTGQELVEIYEHANELIRNRRTKPIKWSGKLFLMQYPKTVLNLMNNKKVPLDELDRFKKMIQN